MAKKQLSKAPPKKKPIPEEVVIPPKKTLSKAEEVKEMLEKLNGPKIPISERVGPAKAKKLSEDKYIRVAENAGMEKFKEMSDRIQNKSLQWAFYAIDNDIGYHYYLELKQKENEK